jgi:hypothetical protein
MTCIFKLARETEHPPNPIELEVFSAYGLD